MDDHRVHLNEYHDDDVFPSASVPRFVCVSHSANDGNDGDGILMRNNYYYLDSDGQWQVLAKREQLYSRVKLQQKDCFSFSSSLFPFAYDKI